MTLKDFWAIAASGAVALSACSLFTRWDPEGLPCNAERGCDRGYCCGGDGRCHAPEPGVCMICEECPLKLCNAGKTDCLPDTCENRVCAVNFQCVQNGSGSACEPVGPEALGRNCLDDSRCGPAPDGGTRLCLRSALPASDAGNSANGVCAELCLGDGGCLTEGAVCRAFNIALDGGTTELCLPANTVDPCVSDDDCGALGHVCTLFDSPLAGPITACATPLAEGEGFGATCTRSDVGPLCANGLCVSTVVPAVCSATCDAASCPSGSCALVPFTVQAGYVPLCIPKVTRCSACTSASDCGADAPQCVSPDGLSAPQCLGPCPDPRGGACPPGSTCAFTGFCVGGCP